MIYVSYPFFISKFKSRLLSALGYLTNGTVYNYLILLLSNTPALLTNLPSEAARNTLSSSFSPSGYYFLGNCTTNQP